MSPKTSAEGDISRLLRRQWNELLDWLNEGDLTRHADTPVGLGAWSITDLVAHLGLGLSLTLDVQSTDEPQNVTSIGRYISSYPAAADEIASLTSRMAHQLGENLVPGLRATGLAVWSALDAHEGRYLVGRRGTLTRDDYLMTRLIEVVVHGDDLYRAMRAARSPVMTEARQEVSATLAAAYHELTGRAPVINDETEWVRRACGRIPSADRGLPLL